MDSTRHHLESQQTPTTGLTGDLQRLQTSGAATTRELREFLAQLKGRSPSEVMGVVAQSSLINSILLATVASAVLLLLLTAIPYAWKGGLAKDETPAPSGTATPTVPPATEAQAADAATAQPAKPDTAATEPAAGGPPDAARAAEAMGIGEVADPDANPRELDGKLDKLLDGL